MTSPDIRVALNITSEIIRQIVHHCPKRIPHPNPLASLSPALGGVWITAALAGLKWSPPAEAGWPGPGCVGGPCDHGVGAAACCIGGAGVQNAGVSGCAWTSPVARSTGAPPPMEVAGSAGAGGWAESILASS